MHLFIIYVCLYLCKYVCVCIDWVFEHGSAPLLKHMVIYHWAMLKTYGNILLGDACLYNMHRCAWIGSLRVINVAVLSKHECVFFKETSLFI